MKKIISYALILCIISINPLAFAKEGYEFFEDFNSCTIGDALPANFVKVSTASGSTEISGDGVNNYLYVRNATTNQTGGADISIGTFTSEFTVSVDLYVEELGTSNAIVWLNNSAARVYLSNKVNATNGAASTVILTPTPVNNTYKVKMTVRPEQKKYDVYINGIKYADDFSFNANITSINTLRLGVTNSTGQTSVRFDNLAVYLGTVSPEDNISHDFTDASEFTVREKVFAENFDSMIDGIEPQGEWTWTRSDDGSAVVNPSNWAGNYLNIINKSGTKDMLIEKAFTAQTDKIEVMCDILATDISAGSNGVLWLENDGIRVFLSTKLSVRKPTNINYEAKTGLTLGVWRRVKVVADITSQKYDLYLDDMNTPVERNLDFNAGKSSFSKVKIGVPRVTGGNTFESQFDNLSVFSYKPIKVLLKSDNEVLNNKETTVDKNKFQLIFDQDMLIETLSTSNISIEDLTGTEYPISISIKNDKQIDISLLTDLEGNKEYRLIMGKGLRTKNDGQFLDESSINFTTGSPIIYKPIEIFDGDNKITNLADAIGNEATVKTSILNYTNSTVNPHFVCVLNKDGEPINVVAATETVSGNQKSISVALPLPADKNGLSVSTFICRDFIDFAPYSDYSLSNLSVSSSYDSKNNQINITGNVGSRKGNRFTIVITQDDVTNTPQLNVSNFSEKVVALKTSVTSDNGNFQITLKPSEQMVAGLYRVFIKGYTGSNQTFDSDFSYASMEDVEKTASALKTITNSNDLLTFIRNKTNAAALDIDNNLLTSLENPGYVSELLLSEAADGIIKTEFYEAVAIANIDEAESNKKVGAFLANSSVLNIGYMQVFTGLNENQKSSLNESLSKLHITKLSDCKDILEDAAITAVINGTKTWVERKKLMITSFSGTLNLDITGKYNTLKDKDAPFIMMKDKIFTDCDDIRNTFVLNTDKQYSVENSPIERGKSGNSSSVIRMQPTQPTIILPETKNEEQTSIPFSDIEDVPWAKEAITHFFNKKYISGASSDTFAPQQKITREEFVKILVNTFGLTGTGNVAFTDVSPSHWSYSFIASAYSNNLINGYTDGRFGIGDYITRQDIAAIIYKIVEKQNFMYINDRATFSDEEHFAEYSKSAIYELAKYGIINGNLNGEFAPNNNATRAEAVVILYRIIKLKEIGGDPNA